jgi:hypothetical protein
MVFGMPWWRMMCNIYNSAYYLTLYVVDTGIKWVDFIKWSTMTHIELYPREVRDKPTMKSMQMFSHFHSGMLKGCRFLAGLRWSALTLRHVSHLDTYFAISCFIRVHQKFFFKSWYILLAPGWIEYLEQWASFMILRWSSKSLGTTSRSLNHITPSASCWKHWASPNSNLWRIWPIPTSVLWAVMTSSLMVGMRAMLFNLPCGTTRRLGSSKSQHEEWGGTVRWLHRCLWFRASATTFAFLGW